jgi:hypothetical protein
MDIHFKVGLIMSKTGRDEMFPMQEQDQGVVLSLSKDPVTCRTERPAAVIFAELLADARPEIPAPVFVP